MKKFFIILGIALLFYACAGVPTQKQPKTDRDVIINTKNSLERLGSDSQLVSELADSSIATNQRQSTQKGITTTIGVVDPATTESITATDAITVSTKKLTQQQIARLEANQKKVKNLEIKYQRYIQLAESSLPPRKQIYELLAAQQLNHQARFSEALTIIESLDYTLLRSRRYLYNFAILKAEIHSAFGDYEAALKALNIVGYVSGDLDSKNIKFLSKKRLLLILNTPQRLQWLYYRAQFYELMSDYTYAIEAYMERSQYISTETQRTANDQSLWNCLNRLDSNQLRNFIKKAKIPLIKGWLSLYKLSIDNRGGIEGQLQKIEEWQNNNPNHPASLQLPESVETLYLHRKQLPKKIALALPNSGPLSQLGRSIRDGFMATYYELHKQGYTVPDLIFLDTATIPNAKTQTVSIEQLYRQAVNAGAEIFIGPLDKSRVLELANVANEIPILALNNVENLADYRTGRQPIYQFSLAVESEIEQIVEEMDRQKVYRVLAVSDNSDFGARAINALATHFQNNDETDAITKELVDVVYLKNTRDYKAQLGQLLLTDESVSRAKNISRIIESPIDFTPRRRQDVDAIFISLNATESRQVMPLLGFYLASNLKVFSTSSIYGGIVNEKLDNDLNGIQFVTMPWLLDSKDLIYLKLTRNKTVDMQQMVFYALGVDAYHLSQRIGQLQQSTNVYYHGAVGTISIQPDYTLKKVQSWAKFKKGKPVVIRRN